MAVKSVREIRNRQRSATKDGVNTHVRAFIVQTDHRDDGTAVAKTANDGTYRIPLYGEAHPGDSTATVRSIDAEPKDENSLYVFVVTVDYSDESNFAEQEVHPLSRSPEYSWDYIDGTAEYFIDKSSTPKPLATSAGEPFENNATRDDGDLVITIVRNEATNNPIANDALKNTLNSTNVFIDGTGYSVGTLKLSPIKAAKVIEKFQGVNVTYYRKTYTIKCKAAGWDDKRLDVGLCELSSGKLKPITDNNGMPVKRPYPLNGSGAKQASPTTTPATLTFKPYESASWSSLAFV